MKIVAHSETVKIRRLKASLMSHHRTVSLNQWRSSDMKSSCLAGVAHASSLKDSFPHG